MRILLCHNYYQQRGGEDFSFEDEARLLEQHGHLVQRYTLHNDVIDGLSSVDVAKRSLWNRQTFDDLSKLFAAAPYDVLHCTNTFPLISLSAYDAAKAAGVPIVQSLRNYRFLCPTSFFMRDGRVCEDCLGHSTAWPGIVHACYRESRAATAVVASISMYHRYKRATTKDADCYYTLTEFARQKFIQGGFPANKLLVKNNSVDPDPGIGSGAGGHAVFAGRLSAEKGISTLLDAWAILSSNPGCPTLKIIGDGPLAPQVVEATKRIPHIQWLGQLSLRETLKVIGDAGVLVMPSVWYETFGRTVIEAFACGTPVIASRLGAMAELVTDGVTGLHFDAGDAKDCAAKVASLLADKSALASMRQKTRMEYETKFTGIINYQNLVAIYEQVIRRGTGPHSHHELESDRHTKSGNRDSLSQDTLE